MSEESEITVLHNMLMVPEDIGEVDSYLVPDDFSDERNRLIFKAIVYQYTLGEPVSSITIRNVLASKKKLTAAGGAAYISVIMSHMGDVTNIGHYAADIKRESIKRSLFWIGKRLQEGSEDPVTEATWGLERLVELTRSASPSEPRSVSDVSQSVLQMSIDKSNGSHGTDGVPTGYNRLDGALLYLQPQSMYLVAARPSVGKSAFVTNIGVSAAKRGRKVLMISLEMTEDQIVRRILSMESKVPYERIFGGTLKSGEVEALKEAELRCRNLPILIDDASRQPVPEIRSKARRQQARDGLDLIIVDYVQLCADDPNDFKQLSSVSTGLKAIAKDLNVPLIGAAQVSRNVEHREGGNRLFMADIRGTGQFEQDSDCVLSIYKAKHLHMVEILKNRHGSTGPDRGFEFELDKQTTTFHERGIEVEK